MNSQNMLKQEFVFFASEQRAASMFTEYIAVMGLWVFIGFYARKEIGEITSVKERKEKSCQ